MIHGYVSQPVHTQKIGELGMMERIQIVARIQCNDECACVFALRVHHSLKLCVVAHNAPAAIRPPIRTLTLVYTPQAAYPFARVPHNPPRCASPPLGA